ncbi:hypothetical protein [Flagellimonas pelagia]|nr:hypothetical protein [Allomuricauda maritima]
MEGHHQIVQVLPVLQLVHDASTFVMDTLFRVFALPKDVSLYKF